MPIETPRIAEIRSSSASQIFEITDLPNKYGNQVATHNILGKGRVAYITGEYEDEFQVKGRVFGVPAYEQIRKILRSQEPLTLTLPLTDASEIDVIITSVNTNIYKNSSIGVFEFDFTALKADLSTKKKLDKNNLKNNSKLQALKKTADFVKNTYRTTRSTIQQAKNTITKINSSIQQVATAIPTLISDASRLLQQVQITQAQVQSIINTPEQIVTSLQSLVNTLADIGQTAQDQITSLKNFSLQNRPPFYNNDTSYQKNISDVIYPPLLCTHAFSLVLLAEKVDGVDYTTREAIINEITYLKSEIDFVQLRYIDIEVKNAMILYIKNIIASMQDKLINIPPTFEYDFIYYSDSSAYYAKYGNLDNLANWRLYNNLQDYGFVNGLIKFS